MENGEAQLVRHFFFSDFELFSEAAKDWKLEYSRLDTTPFHGERFQVFFPDCIIGRGRCTGKHKQVGASPPGFRTFALFADPKLHMIWRGQQVGTNQIAIFPHGGELHAITADLFDIFTISVDEEMLLNLAHHMGYTGMARHLRTQEVISVEPRRMEHLRQCLLRIYTQGISEQRILNYDVKVQMLIQLVKALSEEPLSLVGRQRSLRRLRVLQQAEEMIMSRSDESPTIKSICAHAGVSERTLEYAFAEFYGINPKAYINAIRLNAVRRELRTCSYVADAANARGFWHMGQFAKDYRKLFGELPSAMLR